MKNKQRFENALKALVQGFFDETLAKGSCSACAVGNIVAYSHGKRACIDKSIKLSPTLLSSSWRYFGVTDSRGVQYKRVYVRGNQGAFDSDKFRIRMAQRAIAPTGYSEEEIMRIEYAFETSTVIDFRGYKYYERYKIIEDQFNGLMAVLDVLCEIEGIDSKEYKEYFEYTNDFKPLKELI